MPDRKRIVKIALYAVGGIIAAGLIALTVYLLWEKAPEVSPAPEELGSITVHPSKAPADSPAPDVLKQGLAYDTSRTDGVYTVLLVGNDDGHGNTDTIMVGRIDTVRHRMDFVSIPRDTIINTDWEIRKLNSVYWGAVNNGEEGITALKRHIKKLIGFDIDCYAVLDLDAFVEAVDTLGGIYFDVPESVFYEDYWQGLYLDLDAGYQLLDGYQSMCLCRYRSGYESGDLGRIELQHKFLKAAADQFITLGNIPNAGKVTQLLSESTDTNMSASNIAYFIRQALMCSSDNINFHTAPTTSAYVHDYSYAFIDLYDWINMVNECLNPFKAQVGEGDLDIVYLMGGSVYCTGILRDPGYFDMGEKKSEEPEEEAEEPEELPEEEPERSPEEDFLYVPTPSPKPPQMGDDWLLFGDVATELKG